MRLLKPPAIYPRRSTNRLAAKTSRAPAGCGHITAASGEQLTTGSAGADLADNTIS
jgi:hypothetical protein